LPPRHTVARDGFAPACLARTALRMLGNSLFRAPNIQRVRVRVAFLHVSRSATTGGTNADPNRSSGASSRSGHARPVRRASGLRSEHYELADQPDEQQQCELLVYEVWMYDRSQRRFPVQTRRRFIRSLHIAESVFESLSGRAHLQRALGGGRPRARYRELQLDNRLHGADDDTDFGTTRTHQRPHADL